MSTLKWILNWMRPPKPDSGEHTEGMKYWSEIAALERRIIERAKRQRRQVKKPRAVSLPAGKRAVNPVKVAMAATRFRERLESIGFEDMRHQP